MNLNCTCPFCDNENAYHNGINFECPDCDAAWDEDGNSLNDDYDDDQQEINEVYEKLCKLEKPYFTLKHGQLYECKVDFYNSLKEEIQTEKTYIIPLAFQKNKNQFWVLYDAKQFSEEYPNAVKDFIKMDFTTIWNDGITCYFDDSMIMPLTNVYATTDHNTIMDNDSELYDFKEVN